MGHSADDDQSGTRSPLDRRQFGKILVAGLGGLTLGNFAWAEDCPSSSCVDLSENRDAFPSLYANDQLVAKDTPLPHENRVDVVIVGAGLSGLIAARQLRRAGRTVLVLEARDRIGGRMYGTATKVVPGGYVDFGGQWVGPTQYHMRELAAELKIMLFDSYEEGRSIQSWNGERTGFNGDVSDLLQGCIPPNPVRSRPCPEGGLEACRNPQPPLPDCKHSDKDGAIWDALLEISRQVDPKAPWAHPGARDLDGKTFAQWLDEKLAVDYRRWLSTLQSHIGGSGGFEPKDVSLLHMAWTQKVGPQADTPEQWLMVGGAGQIPLLLAADPLLKGCIVRNAPVTSIRQEKGGVTVEMHANDRHDPLGQWWQVSANAVIVAIPPRLRANITFDPPLHDDYGLFSKGSPMGSMSKVHAVYEKAFWREDCLSGSTAGNLAPVDKDSERRPQACEFIADSSPPGGKPGILTSFIAADRNCEIGNDPGKAEELVLKDYAYYFGDRAKARKEFFYHNWNTDSWTCGAFTSHLGPNVWTSCGEIGWRKPVNNVIFWAGTETSDEWPGYFDGAVKAGQDAATSVCEKVRFGTACAVALR